MNKKQNEETCLPFIYIMGPISNGGKLGAREIHSNVKKSEKIYMELVKKGYNPINPHFSYYPWLEYHEDIDWKTWLKMDENYVRGCPFLFYMTPKKYGPSKGALFEYNLGKKLGKKIFTDLKQVPNLNKENKK